MMKNGSVANATADLKKKQKKKNTPYVPNAGVPMSDNHCGQSAVGLVTWPSCHTNSGPFSQSAGWTLSSHCVWRRSKTTTALFYPPTTPPKKKTRQASFVMSVNPASGHPRATWQHASVAAAAVKTPPSTLIKRVCSDLFCCCHLSTCTQLQLASALRRD